MKLLSVTHAPSSIEREPLPPEPTEDDVMRELEASGFEHSKDSVCEVCGLNSLRCTARAIARGRRVDKKK